MVRQTRLIKRQTLTNTLARDVREFEDRVRLAASKAAGVATDESRKTFRSRLLRPSTRASTPGRQSTRGTFAEFVEWKPEEGDSADVSFDVGRIEAAAPYWLIQEIGTGKTAAIGRVRGGQGRSGPRDPGDVSVKRQRGRVLPRGLIWSGTDVQGRKDEVVERRGRPGPRITIRKEIKGKGYVRIGGNRGFRVYGEELEKAFRSAFGHHPKP